MLKNTDFRYDEHSQMWAARSADAAFQVLNDTNMRVYDLLKYYQTLADETGRRFPLSQYYSQYILLSHEDAHHKSLRKLAAQRFHLNAGVVRAAVDRSISVITKRFTTLGTFDLIDELIGPVTRDIVVAVAGLGTKVVASDILAPSRSLTKLSRVEAELAIMHKFVETHFPDETAESRGMRVGLALIGYEPLKSGLGQNLATLIIGAPGQRLCDIDWPKHLIAPAVRQMVRVARPGQNCKMPAVTIDTALFLNGPTQNASALFGRGAHSCMGRGLSMQVWAGIMDGLSHLSQRVEMLAYTAPDHWLFNNPKQARIRIFE